MLRQKNAERSCHADNGAEIWRYFIMVFISVKDFLVIINTRDFWQLRELNEFFTHLN